MNSHFRLLSGALVLAAVLPGSHAQSNPQQSNPPPLRPRVMVVAPLQAKEVPTRIRSVVINAEISGGFARTETEFTLYNPNARTLEGTLEFPLRAGQSVTGMALDFGGSWRSAVPVPKVVGQQVFEDVSRRKVDPALVEQLQGNTYRVRVYPIPGQGERRVRLQISEKLATSGKNDVYRLPLNYPDLPSLKIGLTVNAVRSASLTSFQALGPAELKRHDADTQTLQIGRTSVDAVGDLQITVPAQPDGQTLTQSFGGREFFLASISKPQMKAPLRKVSRIELLWDSSLSGLQRKTEREYVLLDAYFQQFPDVAVRLQRFSNLPDRPQDFVVRAGDWSALRAELERTVYDGGTDFSALACREACAALSERLLFSDGLDNMTLARLGRTGPPMYVVSSADQSDMARLTGLSEGTGGRVIDLSEQTASAAARQLTGTSLNLRNLSSSGARSLVVQEDEDHWYVAGIRTGPEVKLRYSLLGQQQELNLAAGQRSQLVAQLWATWSAAALQGEPELNQAAIRRLGSDFGVVTPQTSLIVLDTAQDYLRYEVSPPADLRAEYDHLLAQQQTQTRKQDADHLEKVRGMLARYETWWRTGFPKGKPPAPPKGQDPEGVAGDVAAPSVAGMAAASPVATSPAAERTTATAQASKVAGAPGGASSITIQLKKWVPDAPYIARMQKAKTQDLYRIYLDERPSYLQSTAFFLDVADLLQGRKQTALGLRVLSNLAELQLENRAVLRILAYRYLQAGRPDLAIPVFEQVVRLAPNEPQSGRDLGLAYAQAGRRQEALETLYRVVEHRWDARFPEVELMVLNEINALLARPANQSNRRLNTDVMDRSLIRALPLDLRVILTWDADNTDMDLWITDPNGERVYYGHNLSYQGGRISKDFTGGYGPEEFSLRVAKPGRYRIETDYYGNTQQILAGAVTVQAKLTTHFGRADQQDQLITLRLKGAKDTVLVGEFTVK